MILIKGPGIGEDGFLGSSRCSLPRFPERSCQLSLLLGCGLMPVAVVHQKFKGFQTCVKHLEKILLLYRWLTSFDLSKDVAVESTKTERRRAKGQSGTGSRGERRVGWGKEGGSRVGCMTVKVGQVGQGRSDQGGCTRPVCLKA